MNRLRMVVASAFPILTPGRPQAIAYASTENIATDILDAS